MKTFTLEKGGITCLNCGLKSHNPHDLTYLYCGHCKIYHRDFDELLIPGIPETAYLGVIQDLEQLATDKAKSAKGERLYRVDAGLHIYRHRAIQIKLHAKYGREIDVWLKGNLMKAFWIMTNILQEKIKRQKQYERH